MRRMIALVLVASLTLAAGIGSGPAAAANKKLVEGTVYDTTCGALCMPECPPPPHCGPIPVAQGKRKVICAQASIVCPLYDRAAATSPIYSGEGAVVKVRRRGSATVLATLTVAEGHFKIRLGPGEYVFRAFPAEEGCWSGEPWQVKVTPRERGPIPVALAVSDSCAS